MPPVAPGTSSAPIWDPELEDAVLACMLTNELACALAADELRPEDFYSQSKRVLYMCMRLMSSAGDHVDRFTVAAHLPAQHDYIVSLTDSTVIASQVRSYITLLRAVGDRREMRAAALRAAELIATSKGSDLAKVRLEYLSIIERASRGMRLPAGAGTDDVFTDWPKFWDHDHDEAEWVYPDVLARGRSHAIYATHKEGKSLLTLFIAGQLATGTDPVVVVYLDYEMSKADLYDRLDGMGYGPGTDLSRLRYALLPSLPPLDTLAGGEALMGITDNVQGHWPEHHLVVIIDTISRAVTEQEDKADTIRAFYANTGIALKRRGITWARLDHAGKDITRGQRGTSAKGDDVDVVWRLTATNGGMRLDRDVARMDWVPEKVQFGLKDNPLTFTRLANDWPKGTAEVANILDRLELPLDASFSQAKDALASINDGRRRQLVLAALKYRQRESERYPDALSTDPGNQCGNQWEPREPLFDPDAEPSGNQSELGAF